MGPGNTRRRLLYHENEGKFKHAGKWARLVTGYRISQVVSEYTKVTTTGGCKHPETVTAFRVGLKWNVSHVSSYLLSHHHPESTPRQYEATKATKATKVPSSSKKFSSKPQQSTERDRSHRRSNRSRPCRTASHGINSRASGWNLDLAPLHPFGPS